MSLLLNIFREAVQIRDSQGWLPLDYAASFSTVEIFKLLYNAYPEGIIKETGKASILHTAMDNNCKHLEIIKQKSNNRFILFFY